MVEVSSIKFKFSEPFPVNLELETCNEESRAPSPKPRERNGIRSSLVKPVSVERGELDHQSENR
jgi:hypothetical protein